MHGKTSPVFHEDKGVFAGLNRPLTVTRYHSLIVKRETLPECLELTAWTQLEDGSVDEIMGLRHKTLNIEGVQFHPNRFSPNKVTKCSPTSSNKPAARAKDFSWISRQP